MRAWSSFERSEPISSWSDASPLECWRASSNDGLVATLFEHDLSSPHDEMPHLVWRLEVEGGESSWFRTYAHEATTTVAKVHDDVLHWAAKELEGVPALEPPRISTDTQRPYALRGAGEQAETLRPGTEDWSPFERMAPFWQDGEPLEEWKATTATGDVAHLWEQSGRSPFIPGPDRPRAWLMDVRDCDGATLWCGAVDDHGGHIAKANFYDQVLPLAVKRLEQADQVRTDAWQGRDWPGDDVGWG